MESVNCQRAIHPGELLKEEIEYRNLPQTIQSRLNILREERG